MMRLPTWAFIAWTLLYSTECVNPDLGAPDSNNMNMEFTPDDSVAGGVDTNSDNINATILIITTPEPTTTSTTAASTTTTTTKTTTITTTPTTTTATTTAPTTTTTAATTTTTPMSTTTTITTTIPTTTTTTTPVPPTTTRKLPPVTQISINTGYPYGYNLFNWPYPYDQQYNKPQQYPYFNHHHQQQQNFNLWPYHNIGQIPYNNHGGQQPGIWTGGGTSGRQQGSSRGGRFNVPWWMLLMDEV